MGVFKSIGRGISSFGKTISSEISSQIDNAKRKNARWQGYKKIKLKIVDKLSLNELKKICEQYGSRKPNLYTENIITGEKESLGNPREIYLNFVVKHIQLDSLIDYARKKRIPVNEIIKEKEMIDKEFSKGVMNKGEERNFESQMSEEEDLVDDFEKVLDVINEFDPENVRDEKDLENQLKQWLRAILKNSDIKTQYKTERGDIDIVIDGRFGIELKLVENKKTLENLYGQIHKYIKILGKNNLVVVLLLDDRISLRELREFEEDYKNLGARICVLEKGKIKRKKRKVKKATISWS